MTNAETTIDQARVKHTYVLQCECWIGPHLKGKGDEVEMTEAEAQYYVPHVLQKKSDLLSKEKPAPAAKPAKEKK